MKANVISGAILMNVDIYDAKKCDNPNSNYCYKGTATIRTYKAQEGNEKQDYQDFSACNISGYAQVEEKYIELVDGISIDSGLPQYINPTL